MNAVQPGPNKGGHNEPPVVQRPPPPPPQPATTIDATSNFRMFVNARPYVTVIGFAMDGQGKFPIFFRSNKVRSAKNAWSMPSGLHEIGLPWWQQFSNELKEELNLDTIQGTARKIGFYEAIIHDKPGEDNWHWVLLLMAMRVKTLETMVNKEPEKHSDVRIVTAAELFVQFMDKPWTLNLREALLEHQDIIFRVVKPDNWLGYATVMDKP